MHAMQENANALRAECACARTALRYERGHGDQGEGFQLYPQSIVPRTLKY